MPGATANLRLPEGPRFYLGGASPKALGLAARQSDVLLMWIQPLDDTAALIERAVAEFADAGRQPSFGLRTHLVVRDSESEAWSAADELLSQAEQVVREQRGLPIKCCPQLSR